MSKEERFKSIRTLIKANGINSISHLFSMIEVKAVQPYTIMSINTLYRRVELPNLFSADEIVSLADAFEVEPLEMAAIVFKSIKK